MGKPHDVTSRVEDSTRCGNRPTSQSLTPHEAHSSRNRHAAPPVAGAPGTPSHYELGPHIVTPPLRSCSLCAGFQSRQCRRNRKGGCATPAPRADAARFHQVPHIIGCGGRIPTALSGGIRAADGSGGRSVTGRRTGCHRAERGTASPQLQRIQLSIIVAVGTLPLWTTTPSTTTLGVAITP